MPYNSGVIVLVISNHSPDYSLNCTPLSPITISNCASNKMLEHDWLLTALIYGLILQADKFLKCDWLRPVVFKPNLKYLHVNNMPVT